MAADGAGANPVDTRVDTASLPDLYGHRELA